MGDRGHWSVNLWRRALICAIAAGVTAPMVAGVAPASASSHQTQYLLSVAGEDLSVVSADVTNSGGQVLHSYDVASALLVTLPDGAQLPAGAVAVPDLPMTFQGAAAAADTPVNTYRQTIGARDSQRGAGVTVAVVDTGVADTGELDVTHVNASGGPQGDGLGHGTFLAGLIAGNGASSAGAYQGVAPGAKVLDVQVAQPDGSTSLSAVLAGLQAVSDRQAADPSVKVLSLALSTGSPLPPYIDPLTRGLERLWARGVTVVVASGNDGPGEVSSPASDPTLLAVGAVDEAKTPARNDDAVPDFSSFDTMFGIMRPDLVAPGVSLVSLRSPGSLADTQNPDASVLDKYFKGTGTSMSTAVVAGAAATLTGARPALSPNDVKRLLVGTAYKATGLTMATGAGAGGLDLGTALSTPVSGTPKLVFEPASTRFAPDEADAAVWVEFAQAWSAGDLRAVVEAWTQMSPQTRKWAANAWSLAVLIRSFALSDSDFQGRAWAGRRWSTQAWNGRRWSEDSWVGRRWSTIDWSGRRWSQSTWLTANWEGRRWSADDWLAFAWTVRATSDDAVIADMWAQEDANSSTWSGRRWSTIDWAGRRWSEDAWEGRRWSDYVWDGRRWSSDEWAGRRWSDDQWNGRRWSDDQWNGRRWSGRRWSVGEWDGRRWSDLAFEGRCWSTESWDGRRWSVTGWGM